MGVAIASALDIGEVENMRATVSAMPGLGDSIALAGSAEMIQAVSTVLARGHDTSDPQRDKSWVGREGYQFIVFGLDLAAYFLDQC
jgi:hypothetical protein